MLSFMVLKDQVAELKGQADALRKKINAYEIFL